MADTPPPSRGRLDDRRRPRGAELVAVRATRRRCRKTHLCHPWNGPRPPGPGRNVKADRIANREGGPQGGARSADGIPVLRERVGWEGQVHQQELEVRPRAEQAELGVVSERVGVRKSHLDHSPDRGDGRSASRRRCRPPDPPPGRRSCRPPRGRRRDCRGPPSHSDFSRIAVAFRNAARASPCEPAPSSDLAEHTVTVTRVDPVTGARWDLLGRASRTDRSTLGPIVPPRRTGRGHSEYAQAEEAISPEGTDANQLGMLAGQGRAIVCGRATHRISGPRCGGLATSPSRRGSFPVWPGAIRISMSRGCSSTRARPKAMAARRGDGLRRPDPCPQQVARLYRDAEQRARGREVAGAFASRPIGQRVGPQRGPEGIVDPLRVSRSINAAPSYVRARISSRSSVPPAASRSDSPEPVTRSKAARASE